MDFISTLTVAPTAGTLKLAFVSATTIPEFPFDLLAG
jgi:hypothetical protein